MIVRLREIIYPRIRYLSKARRPERYGAVTASAYGNERRSSSTGIVRSTANWSPFQFRGGGGIQTGTNVEDAFSHWARQICRDRFASKHRGFEGGSAHPRRITTEIRAVIWIRR